VTADTPHLSPHRLDELAGYLADPSVQAVADMHSAVRLAVAAGSEALAEVRRLGEVLSALAPVDASRTNAVTADTAAFDPPLYRDRQEGLPYRAVQLTADNRQQVSCWANQSTLPDKAVWEGRDVAGMWVHSPGDPATQARFGDWIVVGGPKRRRVQVVSEWMFANQYEPWTGVAQ